MHNHAQILYHSRQEWGLVFARCIGPEVTAHFRAKIYQGRFLWDLLPPELQPEGVDPETGYCVHWGSTSVRPFG